MCEERCGAYLGYDCLNNQFANGWWMKDTFFWEGQGWKWHALDKINVKDTVSEEKEIAVMNRESELKGENRET